MAGYLKLFILLKFFGFGFFLENHVRRVEWEQFEKNEYNILGASDS